MTLDLLVCHNDTHLGMLVTYHVEHQFVRLSSENFVSSHMIYVVIMHIEEQEIIFVVNSHLGKHA